VSRDQDGEFVDAPDAPDYSEAPEEALDTGAVDRDAWRTWPTWAKLRFIRRLRTEGSGRPEQYIDDTMAWYLWLLAGGRGSGKSDEASRWSAEDALRLDRIRFALIARTFGDVRDTMFEGETGVLAVIPDEALRGGSRDRAYNRSLGELWLANGSKFKGFSSEKPNSLRGPQHHRAWLDEASSWDDADVPCIDTPRGKVPAVDTTMSNLMLGLRLKAPDGSGVRMVAATTPKPNELTEFLYDHPKAVVRILSTYSNLQNLSDEVADVVVGMYEGTDVAAQELEGRLLRQAKGAAWTADDLERAKRRGPLGPPMRRVLGVDPAVSSKDVSDETGLVVVSLEVEERPQFADGGWQAERGVCVEADLSRKVGAAEFGETVVGAVDQLDVDVVVVEINNGYDFVVNAVTSHVEQMGGAVVRRERRDRRSTKTRSRVVIEYVCETEAGRAFVLKPVWQSADKLTRAKAASIWWHQGRARHATDEMAALERQMTTFDGTGKKSPDRLDGLSSAVAEFTGERRRRAAHGASPLADGERPTDGGPRHPLLEEPTPEIDPTAPGRGGQATWAARI
jgi:phage terminase large subunit-like protein